MNPQQNPNVKNIREKLQADVVALITEKLKAGEMSQERAQRIAQMILEKLPSSINYEELMRVVPKLDDEFIELAEVVVPIMSDYEKKIHTTIENRVLELIRQKKFTEAMAEAKKGIQLESELV
jgi:hypothetical protein